MSGNRPSLASLIAGDTASTTAFVFDGKKVTRAQLARTVDQTAAWLAAQGISRGDVVAVWLVNRLAWGTLLFAAARAGGLIAAVNTRYRSAEVEHLLKLSAAKMLVAEAQFRSIDFPSILAGIDKAAVPALERVAVVGAAGMASPWPCVAFDAFTRGYPPAPPLPDDPDAPVLLFTTSGTTKGPKLVAHSQATLAGHGAAIAKALDLSAERHSMLALLPFCGTFGMSGLLGFMAAGITIHALDAFDTEIAFRTLRSEKITHTFGSDEMFKRMLALTDEPRPFPHAELFGFAAFQPGWREFAAQAEARGLPLYGLYGSSEVQALFSIQR